MKRKLKKGPKLLLKIVGPIILFLIIFLIMYINGTSKVSNDDTIISFEVPVGSTYTTLADSLKKNNLIKSEFFYKLYIKTHSLNDLQAGTYNLSENMDLKTLASTLSDGTIISGDYTNITFKEGINMRRVINIIVKETNIKEESIRETLKDKEYLDSLINTYWFITDDIKNDKLYYSLEGYLYPDTYQVKTNGDIKEIFKSMLDNMELKLEPYKKQFQNSKYTIHELLTLASIVELEAANSDDRNGVAGVFYNRLNGGWSLGSDVTTYYGAEIDMSERDLYQTEINEYNAYNTRNSKMAGKLPVGPICIPSIDSIEATINPTSHDYYYFVADKNKKTYFNTSDSGHENTVAKLKRDGLWYEY